MPPSAGRVGGWTTKSGSGLDPLRSSWLRLCWVKCRTRRSCRLRASLALLPRFSVPSKISVGIVTPVQAERTVNLTPAAQKFVLHWGEMGQAWGINRTMAQVHALLFVSPTPLDAEEISTLLDVSRSNVSTSLRELITWGVVRRVHIIGDRRDRFEALKDVMETFRVIMAERKRREMDPTIALWKIVSARPRRVTTRSNTRGNSSRRCSSSPHGDDLVRSHRQSFDTGSAPAFPGGDDAGQALHPRQVAHTRGRERNGRGQCSDGMSERIRWVPIPCQTNVGFAGPDSSERRGAGAGSSPFRRGGLRLWRARRRFGVPSNWHGR